MLAEKTTGHIVAPDGSLLQRPTTVFGADAATIIRAYFFWALSNQLEPELFCATCFDGSRSAKATYDISEQEIVIVCNCQLRCFFGRTFPATSPSKSTATIKIDSEIGRIILSDDDAALLRLYKTVLLQLGLKEALRCNACFELKRQDGCEASVTLNAIRIRCRCSDRVFTGATT